MAQSHGLQESGKGHPVIRRENLTLVIRLVKSQPTLHHAMEPRFRALACGAEEKKSRRRDIVMVMPLLEMAAVDDMLTHPPAT